MDELPTGIPALCRVAQGLYLHVWWAARYGVTDADRRGDELALQSVSARLAHLHRSDSCSLDVARPANARLLGTCRDFALLLCAMLRHRSTPARVRCGFASYLEPGRYEDHWICEAWVPAERRWRQIDSQIDAFQRDWLKLKFDTGDLPEGCFLTAGQAWQRCRAGLADPAAFGHGASTGLWFMRVNVVRDRLSLSGTEVSRWDTWRSIPSDQRLLGADVLADTDRIAGSSDAPFDVAELLTLPWLR